MSFLWVRSPEAPKMTRAHASGVRGSMRPSASGFVARAGCAVSVTVGRSLFGTPLQVAAERLAHRREHPVAPVGLAARGEAVEQRGGEHRNRHALLDRRLHRPAPLAGGAHPPGELVET